MIEINAFHINMHNVDKSYISLCGKPEAYIGNYFLSGVTVPKQEVETLYYDASIGCDDCVELIDENIAAYYLANQSIAFVKKEMFEKLQKGTEKCDITYITVDDFDKEMLYINQTKAIPEYLSKVVWIDDDFFLTSLCNLILRHLRL